MGKCTVMCAAPLSASFVLSAVIMNTISEPVYNSVSGIEEVVYKVSSIASNRASDISMNGSISTGNNYQTGAEQINLTTQRKPEEDVYLIGTEVESIQVITGIRLMMYRYVMNWIRKREIHMPDIAQYIVHLRCLETCIILAIIL